MTSATNTISTGDCIQLMGQLPDGCVDTTVTSCPYGHIRLYEGAVNAFKFDSISEGLYRITRDGGLLVWNEADQRRNFFLSGSSFRHCLAFMALGFNLLDVIIVNKNGLYNQFPWTVAQNMEYAFVLVKGERPNIPDSNILRDRKNLHPGEPYHGTRRHDDASLKPRKKQIAGVFSKCTQVWDLNDLIRRRTPQEFKERLRMHTGQVWDINVAGGLMDTIVPIPTVNGLAKNKHPAVMSDVLAERLVQQYSMPGDVVFDPMAGFGTTTAIAALLNRQYVGIEIIPEWAEVARVRSICAYLTRRQD